MKKYLASFLAAFVFLLGMMAGNPALATPALPVDRDEFSIGNTVTTELTAYGVKSQHTGYKEDNKNAKIFYTRQGTADPAQPLRFTLSAKQSLPGTVQEMEITAQPYDVVNRYAGKKMEQFYRKAKGSEGKKLNVNVEYKIPPKARLLVVTAQLKDYYKEGNKTLPRYTTVEYELRVVGYAEANATPFSGKSVKKVNDGKGKRIIIEDKHSDAITAAIGIGGSCLAAFIYWLLHKMKKKKGKDSVPDSALDQTAASEQPRFCSNCGAKLEPDTRFCGNCGTKV